jgi:hypothetical protein
MPVKKTAVKKKSPAKKTPAKKTAPVKSKVTLTGAEIESQLALAHKINSTAGFELVYMLATRRLNIKRIEAAAASSRAAADHMEALLKLMRESVASK